MNPCILVRSSELLPSGVFWSSTTSRGSAEAYLLEILHSSVLPAFGAGAHAVNAQLDLPAEHFNDKGRADIALNNISCAATNQLVQNHG